MSEPSESSRRCIACDRAGPFPLLFERGSLRLVRCPSCGLAFQHPLPEPAVLEDTFYQDATFSDKLFGPLRETTLRRAQAKLPLLERVGVRRGGKLLDVGASSGAWLEVAASAGWKGVGVEPGLETARRARDRGLDVRAGTLADLGEEDGFDLITFWDVLEHLPDPLSELRRARNLLAPGGLVAATFPNLSGLYPRTTYRLFARTLGVWEHPELVHLYDFSPRSASLLFGRAGLPIRAKTTFGVPFEHYRYGSLSPEVVPLPRGVSRAVRWAFRALRLVLYPLAGVLNRGNAMMVVARRRAEAGAETELPRTT